MGKKINMKRIWLPVIVAFICLFVVFISNTGTQAAVKSPKVLLVSRTTHTVNLKITKVTGASGYQIYRSNKKTSGYKRIKTTKNVTFADKDTKSSRIYYYKVRTYVKGSTKTYYSSFSSVLTARAIPSKVKNVKAYGIAGGVKVSWSKVKTGDKYRIYRATSKYGKYYYKGQVSGTSFVDKKAVKGKTYYYRVRVYRYQYRTKYYGSYSASDPGRAIKVSQQTTSASSQATRITELVNSERKKAGLPAVKLSSSLTKAANIRAKEIVTKFSHTRPNGTSCFTVLKENGISYRTCGENIAYGQRTSEEVMNAWMNSAGHRANILKSSFGEIGVGYYVKNNTAYWVQLFKD